MAAVRLTPSIFSLGQERLCGKNCGLLKSVSQHSFCVQILRRKQIGREFWRPERQRQQDSAVGWDGKSFKKLLGADLKAAS